MQGMIKYLTDQVLGCWITAILNGQLSKTSFLGLNQSLRAQKRNIQLLHKPERYCLKNYILIGVLGLFRVMFKNDRPTSF